MAIRSLRSRRYVLGLLLLLAAFPAAGQDLRAQLDSLVRRYDTLGGFNGLIIIGRGPEQVTICSYGYKDPVRKKGKLGARDRFDLASLTKPFTGLALLQLIEQGALAPDDSLGSFVPGLSPALQKVTVRQLANHTNGIHDYFSLTKEHHLLSNQKVMALLSELDSTAFPPGSRWGYTNSGYMLLSQLIGRVTGRSFEAYCAEQVLRPLGMRSFAFAPAARGVLTGYTAAGKPAAANSFSSGAAGLYASGNDIAAFYKTVCRDTARWRKYFTMSAAWADRSNEAGWDYGFGWYFTTDASGAFRAHSGRNEGAYNYMRWYEGTNTFVCLLSNKNDDFIRKLREEVVQLVLSGTKR